MPGGQHRVRVARGTVGGVALERGERVATVVELSPARRGSPELSSVTTIHARSGPASATSEANFGWVIAPDAARVGDEVLELGGHAAGVGGDGDPRRVGRTAYQAMTASGQFSAWIRTVSPPPTPRADQPGGDPLASPRRTRRRSRCAVAAVLGLPDQERVVGAVLGPVVDQPRDVLAVELVGSGLRPDRSSSASSRRPLVWLAPRSSTTRPRADLTIRQIFAAQHQRDRLQRRQQGMTGTELCCRTR